MSRIEPPLRGSPSRAMPTVDAALPPFAPTTGDTTTTHDLPRCDGGARGAPELEGEDEDGAPGETSVAAAAPFEFPWVGREAQTTEGLKWWQKAPPPLGELKKTSLEAFEKRPG